MQFSPHKPHNVPERFAASVAKVCTTARNSNAIIRIGGDRAFYSPATDHIQLPMESAFQSPEGWAATALHELSHHAGASHRLNRDLSGRFGSDSYSREEMVAEFSSLIIGTELGLPTDIPNHASYIESWLKEWRARHSLINQQEVIMGSFYAKVRNAT